MVPMLIGMTERGPDSAGLAVFGKEVDASQRKLSLYSGFTEEGALFPWHTLLDKLNRAMDVTARIEVDGTTLVDVVVPGRPGSGHCGPKDGWRKDPETGSPVYVNESGFLDRDCTVPADGLKRLRVGVKPVTKDGVAMAKVKFSASGRTAAATPIARVRATAGLGAEPGAICSSLCFAVKLNGFAIGFEHARGGACAFCRTGPTLRHSAPFDPENHIYRHFGIGTIQ